MIVTVTLVVTRDIWKVPWLGWREAMGEWRMLSGICFPESTLMMGRLMARCEGTLGKAR